MQSFQFPPNILSSPSKLVTLILISYQSISELMLCCIQISCCLFGKLNVKKTHTPVLYCFLSVYDSVPYLVLQIVHWMKRAFIMSKDFIHQEMLLSRSSWSGGKVRKSLPGKSKGWSVITIDKMFTNIVRLILCAENLQVICF